MDRQRFAATLMIGVLVMASVPAGVAAQEAPRSVLLDQETSRLAQISLDGQSYTVYRVENLHPLASGIEIYAEDDRVTDESTARRVLTAIARRRAVDELGSADIRSLRRAERNVSRSIKPVERSTMAINDTIAHLETLRSNGTGAYNESVEAAPTIPAYNEEVHEIRPGLRSFDSDARAFVENASALIELVERRENGSPVDAQRLYDRYLATLEATDRLSDHFGIGGVPEQLEEIGRLSGTVAANVSSVPEHGAATATHFRRVADTASLAANRTAGIDLPDSEIEAPRQRVRTLETRWMDRWRSRQNAGTDVSWTMGGIAVAVLVFAGVAATGRW